MPGMMLWEGGWGGLNYICIYQGKGDGLYHQM